MVGGRRTAVALAIAALLVPAASLAAPGPWNATDASASGTLLVAEGTSSPEGPASARGAASAADPDPAHGALDEMPACDIPAPAAQPRCRFTCIAGQEVHAFMEGQGTITATCGGEDCTRASVIVGGCSYQARASGRGTCVLTGLGNGRCYTLPLV